MLQDTPASDRLPRTGQPKSPTGFWTVHRTSRGFRRQPDDQFLAGAELKNVVAAPTSVQGNDARRTDDLFAFRLTPEVDDKDDNTRKTWVQVLQTAKSGNPIEVSLGPAGQPPFPSTAKIKLDVYPTLLTYGTLAVYLSLAYFIIRLGRTSWMLRDANGASNPPYSLARHQMAIWTIVVVGAYLHLADHWSLCLGVHDRSRPAPPASSPLRWTRANARKPSRPELPSKPSAMRSVRR
jgi:hypothetical protein